MRIPEETVERIRQAADIVEVVGDFVSLKKRGSNWIACCPFHNEKTPSFNVNPSRQIYKCFGCGKAGDAVRFVMDIENIGYGEALRFLAKKYGIEIEEREATPEEQLRQNERESLFIVLNFAKTFFQETLHKTDEGQGIGLSYFRERGFTNPVIDAFELGYSPDAWDALMQAARQRGYNVALLEKAGLVVSKEGQNGSEGRVFDRFRGRVMFPIHNVAGRVIAFGARTLKADKNQPKYLNSPETEAYHKSQVLYGIFQAKQTIRQEDVCYLTEGYTDVISLHQAGIRNVVASSGTSLTIEQIRLIGRFTQNVTILYDGDAAGVKAALRGLDLVLEEGLNVSVATFPDGDDPDSYVRKVGAEAFREHLRQNTLDFITFKTNVLLRDAGDNPFRRAEVISEIVSSITRIPDPIQRQVFFRTTAERLRVDEQTLISESNRLIRQQQTKRPDRPAPDNVVKADTLDDINALLNGIDETADKQAPPADVPLSERRTTSASPTTRSPLAYQEQECIRLLVNHGTRELEPSITLCHYVLSELGDIEFTTPPYNLMLTLFRKAFAQGDILTANDFLHEPADGPALQQETINLTTPRYELSDGWQKHEIVVPTEDDTAVLAEAAYSNILRIKKLMAEQRMSVLMQQIRQATDATTSDQLMLEYMQLKRVDMEIARLLGTVISG